MNGHTVLAAGAQEQLAAVEGAGGMVLLAGRLAPGYEPDLALDHARTAYLEPFLRDYLVHLGLVDGDPRTGQAIWSDATFQYADTSNADFG